MGVSQEFSGLVDDVFAAGPFDDRAQAEGATRATLATLRQRLVNDEAKLLAAELPKECGEILHDGHHDGDFDLDEFYQRVAQHEHMTTGRALEHSQLVCQALVRRVSPAAIQRLRRHLPEFSELFELPAVAAPPEVPHKAGPSESPRNTLSGGRQGSQHPVSSAHPIRAQSHSVARSDDPHGDTKLSSSRGLTQERESETLADGKPKVT